MKEVTGLHLAASPGGHLDLLEAVAEGMQFDNPAWVTVEGPRASGLRAREAGRVLALPWFERRAPLSVLRNVVASIAAAVRERPRVVICAGAGSVLTFALVARALGARLIFVETMARVGDASATARLLGRVAEAVVVQWPENERLHRRSIVCRPLLLNDLGSEPAADGARRSGTAAFVGTHSEPFGRLIQALDRAAASGTLPGPVAVQAGVLEYASEHMQVEAWVTSEEVCERMRAAEVVVVHGGAGMISTALRAGRRPIVMCRRRDVGEHVDDHQRQLADKLAGIGLVVVVDETISERDVALARVSLAAPDGLHELPSVDEVLADLLAAPGRHR